MATEISPFSSFYHAEAYHQRYFEKNGVAGCAVPEAYLRAGEAES